MHLVALESHYFLTLKLLQHVSGHNMNAEAEDNMSLPVQRNCLLGGLNLCCCQSLCRRRSGRTSSLTWLPPGSSRMVDMYIDLSKTNVLMFGTIKRWKWIENAFRLSSAHTSFTVSEVTWNRKELRQQWGFPLRPPADQWSWWKSIVRFLKQQYCNLAVRLTVCKVVELMCYFFCIMVTTAWGLQK